MMILDAPMLVMLLVPLRLSLGVLKPEALHYVESDAFYGNLMVAKGIAIQDSFKTHVGTVASRCACRTYCWTKPSCKGFSTEPIDGGNFTCKHTTLGPLATSLENVANSEYVYRLDTIRGFQIGFLTDGNFYLNLNMTRDFTAARRTCKRIPGFQLGLYEDDTVNVLNAISRSADVFYLNLRRITMDNTHNMTTINTNDGSDNIMGNTYYRWWFKGPIFYPNSYPQLGFQDQDHLTNVAFVYDGTKIICQDETSLAKVVCQTYML